MGIRGRQRLDIDVEDLIRFIELMNKYVFGLHFVGMIWRCLKFVV